MTIVPLKPAEQNYVLGRVHGYARFYNGGTQLGTVEALELLLDRLTEAERKLAKIAHALNSDERTGGMTSVPDTQPAQTDDEATGYPETWKFAEHGDLVAGTFVRFDEGPTRDYGMRVILVLDVDGAERSIWLSQTALFNKVKDELNRRTTKTLEPGERVVVQRHEKTTSENGRSYWPFAVSFPDRPEKSTTDLFDLDEGPVAYETKEPTEPARLKAGPDEPIVDVKTEPVAGPDDGIPF